MDLNRKNMKNLRYLIAFAVLLYLGVENIDIVFGCLKWFGGLILPFVLGAAIAFILNVPMRCIERNVFGKKAKKSKKAAKIARPISLVLSVLALILVLMVVVLVVAPELGSTIVSVVKRVEANIPQFQKWVEETFSQNPEIVEWVDTLEFDPQKIINSIGGMLKFGVDNILSSTVSITVGIVSTAANVGIGFIFACYILLQKEKLLGQVKKAVYAIFPIHAADYIEHVCVLASKTFASFITGQCIEAVILGSMFFVSMSIFRFPYAMLVGVLISFTALIPVFGGFIGCAVGFFLILMVSPLKAVLFLGLFLVLQQIEGNFIYPHVVGNSVGLPSIWVLTAVTLGGSLMGVVGMLVFIPLVSVFYTLFREWVYKRLEEKQLFQKEE